MVSKLLFVTNLHLVSSGLLGCWAAGFSILQRFNLIQKKNSIARLVQLKSFTMFVLY